MKGKTDKNGKSIECETNCYECKLKKMSASSLIAELIVTNIRLKILIGCDGVNGLEHNLDHENVTGLLERTDEHSLKIASY